MSIMSLKTWRTLVLQIVSRIRSFYGFSCFKSYHKQKLLPTKKTWASIIESMQKRSKLPKSPLKNLKKVSPMKAVINSANLLPPVQRCSGIFQIHPAEKIKPKRWVQTHDLAPDSLLVATNWYKCLFLLFVSVLPRKNNPIAVDSY